MVGQLSLSIFEKGKRWACYPIHGSITEKPPHYKTCTLKPPTAGPGPKIIQMAHYQCKITLPIITNI